MKAKKNTSSRKFKPPRAEHKPNASIKPPSTSDSTNKPKRPKPRK